ncbi:MAG: hypothetical protein WAV20_07445 [Blastocatellia bacterium]
MTSRLANIFLIFLLLTSNVRAQSAGEGSAAEEKKAREERAKKTMSLVDQIAKESESLRLPENRIRVDIALAKSLWPRDAKRASSLFRRAVATLGELATAAVDYGDQSNLNMAQLPHQLRQEILQVTANHDAGLALEFLRAGPPAPQPNSPNYSNLFSEGQLAMRLALQIADKDPQQALVAAEHSMKLGLDYEAMSLLYQLDRRDKAAAERFFGSIMTRLRTGDWNKNYTHYHVGLTLLRTWFENNKSRLEPPAQRSLASLSLPNIDEETARELSNIILNRALDDGPNESALYRMYSGQITGVLQQLKVMLPDIERLNPSRVAALRQRLDELEKFTAAQQGPWAKYNQLFQSGTVEAMMEAAKTAAPEVADRLIQQAASRAYNARDFQTASQIGEKIADPRQRAEMKSNLDRHAFYFAREQKKLAEARAAISRLASVEERAIFLAQLADSYMSEGDKAAAFQVLGEAEALLGDRAANYGQLQAQLQIAGAYAQLDVNKSAAVVERVIEQVNELSAAALVLNGFDVQHYFRSGEFIINGAGGPLNMIAQESGKRLASVARMEFDRARLAAERYLRPEMRVIALLQIASDALTIENK